MIAYILNAEGYSKLNQIAKESVKAVLAENKKLISASFAAIIHTLRDHPEMVNLIYSTSIANSSEQYKDDNSNNITKYLNVNKDRLLDLTEKNYENLVEALTNDSISSVAASSSSNPTLSLPSSSSIFDLDTHNQSDAYKSEEPESFHNNKGNSDY